MRERRDRQTELLVIVTPYIVEPMDAPPAVPPGEPEEWRRHRRFQEGIMGPGTGREIVPLPVPHRQ
jgi:hypothetical protein